MLLVSESLANIFNSFADLATRFAETLCHFTLGVFGTAFGFEFLVVDSSAYHLFCFPFSLIEFAFNFIFVR